MKAAVVGYGRMGRVHAAALRRLPDVSRIILCDPAIGGASREVAGLGSHVFEDVDDMLAAVRPDVVHVCTPPATHAQMAIRALRAGARVLVEKPMALGSEETARLAAIERAHPGALCVGHNYLFEPEVVSTRRWVAEGRIGRPLGMDFFYGVDSAMGVAGPGAWAERLPGGRFTDLLPHPVYLAAHFLGAVHGVSARWRGAAAGSRATELGVVLECEHGLATIHVSLATVPWELGFSVRGTAGTARVDLARQRAVLVRPRPGRRQLALVRTAASAGMQNGLGMARRVAGKLTGRLGGYPGLRALIARFYASIHDGLPPPVPFGDGAAVASVLERVRLQLAARTTNAATAAPREQVR
jgi:predicted dehydrogenase